MLYVWMPEGQGNWLWCIAGESWQSEPSLEQLIQHVQLRYSDKDAIVFFPTQTAQFESRTLPRAQYKQLGVQGVQYLIEENSIESVDQLSIFHDYQHEILTTMALPTHLRDTYQHTLALLPWHVEALLPDFLLLPEPEDGQLIIAQIENHVLWRWAKLRGWQCADLSLVSIMLPKLTKIKMYDLSLEQSQVLQEQCAAQEVEIETDTLFNPEVIKSKKHPFNALVKVKKQRQGVNYWRASAALLAVAIITQVTYDGLRWWKYKQIADQTAQLAVGQYQQWFPNETRINESNLVTQFTAKVRANASADVRALEMIGRIGPILQQANIPAQQVQYQDNLLSLSLLAPNAESLNTLTAQLKQQGLSAELGAIRNEGQKVVGMIKVQ